MKAIKKKDEEENTDQEPATLILDPGAIVVGEVSDDDTDEDSDSDEDEDESIAILKTSSLHEINDSSDEEIDEDNDLKGYYELL